jgi:hypothetical protein
LVRLDISRAAGKVLGEIGGVLRLAFTLRLNASAILGREVTIGLLWIGSLALWFTLEAQRLDAPLMLDLRGLPAVGTMAAAVLGVAWMLAHLTLVSFRRTLWLVSGYLPAVAAGAWALGAHLPPAAFAAIAGALGIHAALYFFFGLRALAGRPEWLGWMSGTVSVVVLLGLGSHVQFDPSLWAEHQTTDQLAHQRESAARAEELMYAQPERLEAALGAIDSKPAPKPRMYFLGFAGVGEQKVFAQEIALAARRVHERYDTSWRGISLVNDRRDFDRHPLASPAALQRAIQGTARRMNRDEDVLFLALSSHGKRDATLVVTHGALPLNWLTGEGLARMLRESGIQWKVVVISACYAGAFIEHLRDDRTIVITASSADRTSFGCNHRSELTYFGEAFYRNALATAPDLPSAFAGAVAQIEARERSEGLVPSQPLAHFGAAMVARLSQLEALRDSRGVRH